MSTRGEEELLCPPRTEMDSIFPLPEELFGPSITESQRVEEIHPQEAVSTVKHATPENDSFSDDTQPEYSQLASNDNSNNTSPTKPMNDFSRKSLFTSVANDPHLCAPKPHDVRDKMAEEVDIAHFIDTFLESDDGINQVPHLTHEVRPEFTNVTAFMEEKKPVLQANTLRAQPSSNVLRNVPKSYSNAQAHSKGSSRKPPGGSGVGRGSSAASGKKAEKRKPRTYSQAIPSQHCHICSRRPTEGSPHQVCGNLLKGRCRKTICTKCFHQFRWDLKAAREAAPGTWECPHCRGECPQRAQCVIYNRTSDRRRLKLINHRKRKNVAEGSKVEREVKRQALEKENRPDSGRTVVISSSVPVLKTRVRGEGSARSAQLRNVINATAVEKVLPTTGRVLEIGDVAAIGAGSMRQSYENGRGTPGLQTNESAMGADLSQPLPVWGSNGNQGGIGHGLKEEETLHVLDGMNCNLELFGSPQGVQSNGGVGTQAGTAGLDDKEVGLLGHFTICVEDLVPAPSELQAELIGGGNYDGAETGWGLSVGDGEMKLVQNGTEGEEREQIGVHEIGSSGGLGLERLENNVFGEF